MTVASQASRPPPPCPICGKPSTKAVAPFCSARCAQIDLGRWFGEQYRVPTEEPPMPDGEAGSVAG